MKLWHPEIFQGSLRKKHYFEGWYFKIVDKEEKHSFAIIPAIALSEDESHSFIQFFSGHLGTAQYFTFKKEDFITSHTSFNVSIDKSEFSLKNLNLHINSDGYTIQSNLSFKNTHKWPVKLLSPGVMGWYRFVPFMECYHGVLSFNHKIEGTITVNGEVIDMTGGKGYIEKDWGRSMPDSWIWMQTNHFENDNVSLFGSVAKIPWLGKFFSGFIFGLFIEGKTYSFTTYTGAKITHLGVNDKHIDIIVEDKRFLLKITADRENGADLPAPQMGKMTSKVNESLRSKIKVELTNKKKGIVIFTGTGRNAGLEFVGKTSELYQK